MKDKYSKLWKDPRWQRCRLSIFNRDDWQCRLCGARAKELATHHIKYTTAMPWEESRANLITVCVVCHDSIDHCRSHEDENAFRSLIRPLAGNDMSGFFTTADAFKLVPRPEEVDLF